MQFPGLPLSCTSLPCPGSWFALSPCWRASPRCSLPKPARRPRPDVAALDRLAGPEFGQPYLHLYTRDGDGFDLRTRQFSSSDPLLEDPATGSANAALAGLLAHYDRSASAAFRWRIAQGVEMGRPSVLEARAEKQDGRVVNVWIGGEVGGVTEGLLEL